MQRGGSVLVRAIGPWALGANAVNLTVGAGIFALPAVVAAILGPAAILAYAVCAALVLLVLLCFAEVGSRVTRSGGAIAYIEAAFGPLAGFMAWATMVVGFSIATDAAIANFLADALATVWPPLGGGPVRVLFFAALFGGLAAINIRGVRQGVGLSVALTVVKLVPLLMVVALGVFAVEPRNLVWTQWPAAGQVGAAALTLFFAFAGIESALTPSGEIRDPARTVPRGILGAAIVIALLYMALQATAQGVLGEALVEHQAAPLAEVAAVVAGEPGRILLMSCAALAVFGALAAETVGTPRAFVAAAESGALPRVLANVHPRWRTPWVAILVFAGCAFVVASTGGFRPLAVLGSLALLLLYLGVVSATLRLRRSPDRATAAFRTPGGPLVPLLAAAAVLWLMSHSTLREVLALGALLVLAALYGWWRGRRGRPGFVVEEPAER